MSDDEQTRPSARPFLASGEVKDAPLLPSEPSRDSNTSGDFGIPTLETAASTAAAKPENAESATPPENTFDSPTTATPDRSDHLTIDPPILSSVQGPIEAIAAPMPHYKRKQVEPKHDDMEQPIINLNSASTKKIKISMLGGTVAVLAIAIGVYGLNQDVYSLNHGQDDASTTAQIGPVPTKPTTLAAISGKQTLGISAERLPQLKEGHYQLWLEQDGQTTSLGKFSINDQGKAVANDADFTPEATFSNDPASLFVTVEPGDEVAVNPSSSIIAIGSLTDRTAELSFKAIDLGKAAGSYILAAPSDLTGENQTSGIWLAQSDGQKVTGPGLTLPVAPNGWVYESQLLYKDQIIAMGRFKDPAKADSMTKFTPNPDKTPKLPGEDYLEGAPSRLGVTFPTNLGTGEWKVLISVEPDLNGSDPSGDSTFSIHILAADIASDSQAFKEYALKPDLSSLPKVTVTVK